MVSITSTGAGTLGYPDADAAPAIRAAKAARGNPVDVRRSTGLETAAVLLGGQHEVAAAIGIEPRSLRAKINHDRGISDSDLIFTARALETQGDRLIAHAAKLRAVAGAAR